MQTNDLTNREIGDYHILRRIGVGAMAEVYLAEQRSLRRRVAFKVLKPELASDNVYLQRFLREARAIGGLVHPNIVQVYQVDQIDGVWFIAQEFVSGQTLQELLKRKGSLSANRVAEILWQISSALDCAAQAEIVHRDVKPDNILLGDNGDIKIADFGLARVNNPNETANLSLTQFGMTLGTPLYMSPEQAQGQSLDQRSDMYSLGITAYHALAGQPPFRGDTPLAVALQHVNAQPESLAEFRSDVPPALLRIIHRMIEKDPNDRFQTFRDVLKELRAVLTVSLKNSEATNDLTGWNRPLLDQNDEMLLLTTEKLQHVMLKEKRHKPLRWKMLWSIFCIPLIFAVAGIAFGYIATRFQSEPLREPTSARIQKKETVQEQWVYACYLNNPEAWFAVIDNFPDDDYLWGRKAKRQLIRYFFHLGDSGDSVSPVPIFQEFASFSDIDLEDQALGLAGLAWASAENQEDMRRPMEYLRLLYDLPISYSDPLLIQIIDAAQEKIQKKNRLHEMRTLKNQ